MELISTLSFVFAGISLIVAAWVILLKQKEVTKNIRLNDRLVQLEAQILETKHQNFANSQEKKNIQVQKVEQQPVQNNSELLLLRKELSHFKDEVKKLKEDLRVKEKNIKDLDEKNKNKLYSLTEENTRLIAQLKDLDKNLKQLSDTHKNHVSPTLFEEKNLELKKYIASVEELNQKNIELEKQRKFLQNKQQSMQEKIKQQEVDLKKWEEIEKALGEKQLDAKTFVSWYDRAMVGRKMYKLMKQMRELSESKVQSYQDGIKELSLWILKQKGLEPQKTKESEANADLLLGLAWDSIKNDYTKPSEHDKPQMPAKEIQL